MPAATRPRQPTPAETTRWLVQLRWLAVAGQVVALMVSGIALELRLPWAPLLTILFITSFTNHFIANASRPVVPIIADTILLTVMLYFTGGADNPFVCFYLLFVALAAMMTSPRGLTGVVVLCAAGFLFISLRAIPFSGPPEMVKDGHLTAQVHRIGSALALGTTAGFIALFVHRLHVALVRRESALVDAERRAAHTERFEGLATLSAGIAHELGTPLGTIAIVSKDLERALERVAADPATLEDARLIRSEVDRCTAILGRLDRETTQGTGAAFVEVRTGQVGDLLLDRLTAGIAARVQFRDLAGDRKLDLTLDPVLQSLVVLVENACEADPSGRPVEVEIEVAGGEVVFRVIDHGKGMTEAQRRRAGEPYFTTKSHAGTGLGLFLVRTLTQRLGGSVELHPRANGGTCAVLILPVLLSTSPSGS
ncbi:MAG: regB1 [Akkermansiaceae bacterium]|nr:regB1 [Akkermansiaceae bacterium]